MQRVVERRDGPLIAHHGERFGHIALDIDLTGLQRFHEGRHGAGIANPAQRFGSKATGVPILILEGGAERLDGDGAQRHQSVNGLPAGCELATARDMRTVNIPALIPKLYHKQSNRVVRFSLQRFHLALLLASLCELLLHVPFLFLVQLNPMLKALPFIKAFAQFVAAMDETEVGCVTVGADKLFAALKHGCANPLTDGCGMQVDPKELCALRRQTNIAEADNLFPINGHIKEDLLGCNQWRQGIEACRRIVGAHELLDKGRVKDRCIGELPSRLGDHKDGVTIG